MLTYQQALGSIDDLTFAEASQMYAEHSYEKWQHTAAILAMIENANKAKGAPAKPDNHNPWVRNKNRTSVPLNTPEGFQTLRMLADGGASVKANKKPL